MGSVRGPLGSDQTGADPFLQDFLAHAGEDDCGALRPGDVISLDGLTVMYGDVISIVFDPLEREGGSSYLPRVRVRARLREPTDPGALKLPFGHVLVKGVEAKSGRGIDVSHWCPVEAARLKASEAGNLRGVIVEFFVYDSEHEDEDNLRDGAVFTSLEAYDVDVLESPSHMAIWDRHQSRIDDVEGVLFRDDAVHADLIAGLNRNISKFASSQVQPDYHPNSKDIVLDIVHPSLFSYVAGVSEVNPEALELAKKMKSSLETDSLAASPRTDRWGREFSESKFAWLPAVVDVSTEGECKFTSYINNLPLSEDELYSDLGTLFGLFLPMFEEVYRYIMAIQFHGPEEDDDDWFDKEEGSYEPNLDLNLRERELKVVVKIVDYELSENDIYDGVWHVEGMSHESIVMTGLYILDRDEDVEGGEILFKRAFLDFEAAQLFMGLPQCRHPVTEKIVGEGMQPLGTLRTPRGRMIVFPNSHVHKVKKMRRKGASTSGEKSQKDEKARRRIVVFWVVDPEREDMLTSRDVPEQQNIIPREDALRYRLELMEERKRHKQDFNLAVREIELCEH